MVGCGMGDASCMTLEAKRLIETCDLLIGSSRLVESLDAPHARRLALIRADEIEQRLRRRDYRRACVVMSGDVGLFSGARQLLARTRDLDVTCVCGISSLQYLCARLGVPWEDAHIASAHGTNPDLARIIGSHGKTFLVAGTGETSVEAICARLVDEDLGDVRVCVGERLSYPDERIVSGTAVELAGTPFSSLSCLLVTNERARPTPPSTPWLDDGQFVRGSVPMTKQETRAQVLSCLKVRATDTVWDVGAGTGSVAIACAHAAFLGSVFAIEHDEEALSLIRTNSRRLGARNLTVVAGRAPEALVGLPAPDAVFIGGTKGALAEIARACVEANPQVRICLCAITLETLTRALDALDELGLPEPDVIQMGISRLTRRKSSRLLLANNPVFVVSTGGER